MIEIGSRAARLFAATADGNDRLRVISTGTAETGLREGIASGGKALTSAISRTIIAVREFMERVERLGIDTVRIVGTDALRAIDPKALTVLSESCPGLIVLTEEQEAYMSLVAAAKGLGPQVPERQILLIDSGSGSTECAYGALEGTRMHLLGFKGYPLGTQALGEELQRHRGDVKRLRQHVLEVLREHGVLTIEDRGQPRAIALGSGATKLAWYLNIGSSRGQRGDYDPRVVHGQEVAAGFIEKVILYAERDPSALLSRDRRHRIEQREVVTAVIGAVVLAAFMRSLRVEKVTVSGWGMRYGVAWCLARPDDCIKPLSR